MGRYIVYMCLMSMYSICTESHTEEISPTECTRKCYVDDKDDECWKQSLQYFTETLSKSLQEYSATLIHMERWKHRNPELDVGLDGLLQSAVSESLSVHSDERSILTAEDILKIFNNTIIQSRVRLDHFLEESTYLPLFSCPLPCEYATQMWFTLTIVMTSAFILCCVSFLLYMCVHENKGRRSPKHVPIKF